MVSLFRARPSALRLGALLLVRDQAAVAFSSAAVLRPAASSLMPLRRTPRRPETARNRWVRCWLCAIRPPWHSAPRLSSALRAPP